MADVKVPAVGESISEVFIGTWLKQQGDAVERDEALVEIETDKATMEVPATAAGVLSEILKQEGDSAVVGEVIARVEEGEAAAEPAPREEAAAEPAPQEEGDAEPAPQEEGDAERAPPEEAGEAPAPPAARSGEAPTDGAGEEAQSAPGEAAEPSGAPGTGHVMPAARRLLEERGVSVEQVPGTGPGGRVLKEDVERFLHTRSEAPGPAPQIREAPSGDGAAQGQRREEAVPMSPLRRTIARRLVEAQQAAALLTTFNEIDMSEVMALRSAYKEDFEKRYEIRLGFMSFFMKAAIDALKTIPQLNAEIREQSIVYKDYYDIAVAVSTEKGLVTPVVRDAERLSFAELESAIADFGKRAQANRLTPDELRGGTFTITNGGVFGSLLSTPIVNPPQSGVLGMHTIQERPVAIDGRVEVRPMMYVALTYDHRIVDGREAVTFLRRVKEAVERPARMLLEV